MTTNASDIRDILTVQGILNNYSDDGDEAEAIAALLDWRSGAKALFDALAEAGQTAPVLSATVENKPKGKPGKATESKDSDTFEATPDPSDDDPGF